MDESAEVVTETAKATVEEKLTVAEFRDVPDSKGTVSYACPKCHRRVTGPKNKPHLCACGATISTRGG